MNGYIFALQFWTVLSSLRWSRANRTTRTLRVVAVILPDCLHHDRALLPVFYSDTTMLRYGALMAGRRQVRRDWPMSVFELGLGIPEVAALRRCRVNCRSLENLPDQSLQSALG